VQFLYQNSIMRESITLSSRYENDAYWEKYLRPQVITNLFAAGMRLRFVVSAVSVADLAMIVGAVLLHGSMAVWGK
jgi:hypothetical protein